MTLLLVSIAPIIIIAFYIYFRDKYEKEPIGLLLLSLLSGGLIVIPILLLGSLLKPLGETLSGLYQAGFDAFIMAAFIEEGFKFLAVYLLIWKNKNFNEKFDGIVYAVFVSLGFALVENIIYVFSNGLSTGLLRASTAVPFHAIDGVIMGFYFGIARFKMINKSSNLAKAFILPFIFHGLYDFFLMSQNVVFLLLWIPLLVYLWRNAFKKMKLHSQSSVFNDENHL
ncbi:MAG: PrsW family intramembrane metalloprotease [Bacteroidetes bacterium]|nr:PrsW family intramembrane metalloprotease [Bacteroidota bacterium]MBT4730047.1 PrsW family intramembrane metalloprotease [Bacteroidota bacterium]MBT7994395.1 PrsW family intramembrane metalloprotease [Bacteroidota bacterium]